MNKLKERLVKLQENFKKSVDPLQEELKKMDKLRNLQDFANLITFELTIYVLKT